MKKHTPEAQYNFTCEFCEKRFEKLDSVKFHKLKSHPDKQATWAVQTLVTGAEQVQVGPLEKNQREASSDETDFPLLCLSYLSCPGWCEPVTTQAVSEGKKRARLSAVQDTSCFRVKRPNSGFERTWCSGKKRLCPLLIDDVQLTVRETPPPNS